MSRDWTISVNNQQHSDRVTRIRSLSYEMSAWPENERYASHLGQALALNISSGGMLLLSDVDLGVQQVLKIFVPSESDKAQTPTLAEVRWARPIPFDPIQSTLFFRLEVHHLD